MVMVRFEQTPDTLCFSSRGHAGYAKAGQPDIVCAAVSALSMTLCNGLVHCPGFRCSVKSGDVSLQCDRTHRAQAAFDIILTGFHGLMMRYPDHVSIDTRERPLKGEDNVSI